MEKDLLAVQFASSASPLAIVPAWHDVCASISFRPDTSTLSLFALYSSQLIAAHLW